MSAIHLFEKVDLIHTQSNAMETTICFFEWATSNNERWYWVVQTLGYHFRDHCMHLYIPLSTFNFCNFLHDAPKQCKKIEAQLRLYEHLWGTVRWNLYCTLCAHTARALCAHRWFVFERLLICTERAIVRPWRRMHTRHLLRNFLVKGTHASTPCCAG